MKFILIIIGMISTYWVFILKKRGNFEMERLHGYLPLLDMFQKNKNAQELTLI